METIKTRYGHDYIIDITDEMKKQCLEFAKYP